MLRTGLLLVLCGCRPPDAAMVPAADGDGGGTPVEDSSSDGDDTGADGADGGGRDTGDDMVEDIDSPLCINELMPDNQAALDVGGATPDWIELMNPSDSDLSLEGWTISDDRAEADRHPLSGDLVVPAGGFLLLYADGLPESGSAHLSFALSRHGGDVALFEPDGDSQVIAYGEVEGDFSLARRPDCCSGADCIEFVFRGTPGASNGDATESKQ